MAIDFDFARAKRKGTSFQLDLTCVYHLHADTSYNVIRRLHDENMFIAVYTIGGCGCINLSERIVCLPADSLTIIRNDDLTGYFTDASPKDPFWHFWWFEFRIEPEHQVTIELPFNEHVLISRSIEYSLCESCLEAMKGGQNDLASGIFSGLLSYWLYQSCSNDKENRSSLWQQALGLIEKMPGELKVSHLAQDLNISERSLRNLFKKHSGLSPKQFLIRYRIDLATELLNLTTMRISEIADQLGFPSLQQFSHAFKNYTGFSPCHFRKNGALKHHLRAVPSQCRSSTAEEK